MNNRILIVDDDANCRKTLADILRSAGYETVSASTGTEALAVAGHGVIGLALIDLVLPDMPGLDVMVQIKAISPLTEHIILTGNASLETAMEATRHGAFCYMLKPYQMDELLHNIRHAVERRQARQEILRLASFPRLNHNPVIELNRSNEVTYLNPAAETLFPDLTRLGLSHSLLQGSEDLIDGLWHSMQHGEVINEACVGAATYELRISYISEADLIRIYALDISQRKRAEEEIYLLATTDSLTGLTNRREFSSILSREVVRATRYDVPLSLVMYDLDHFKNVNDTYGHDVGDYALQAVTGLVISGIRANDVAARWGGEEFMVLLPQTNLHSARNVAEKLRLLIAEHRFDKVNRLTASLGVTEFEAQDDTNSLLKRVDNALYRAKQHGRNRVETLSSQGNYQ